MGEKVAGLALAAVVLASPAYAADASGEANKQLVKQFLAEIRIASTGPNRAAAIRVVAERYMAADYVQHSLDFPPGREGYIAAMSAAPPMRLGPPPPSGAAVDGPPVTGTATPEGPPRGVPKDIYFIADGDLVTWVSEIAGQGASDQTYKFNMFRIKDGKFLEHWDSK